MSMSVFGRVRSLLGTEREAETRALSTLDAVVVASCSVAVALSVVLAFWKLALMGLTFDERTDFNISKTYVLAKAFLDNTSDPAQGRLGHLLGAASCALFGVSYFAFKLPFVLVGIAGGVGLYRLLRRNVSMPVAVLFAAFYASCPYVLAASRTAATAGDVLVLVLTLAFVSTLEAWMRKRRFWFAGALCAAACGAAMGAKWTCGLLCPAAVLGYLWSAHRRRALRDGWTWTQLFAFASIAAGVAVLASPTFLLGLDFVRDAVKSAGWPDKFRMFQFGMIRAGEPWYYVPAVLVSKVSPVVVAAGAVGLCLALVRPGSERERPLAVACWLSLVPMVPLALKPFQNAHYYVGSVPALLVGAALAFDRGLDRIAPKRKLASAYWALSLLALASQLGLSIWLSPDFLQAGRQYGPLFQGQFMGPAVNHCQGGPFAIAAANELVETSGIRDVYYLSNCVKVLEQDAKDGPIHPKVPIREYPKKRPSGPHFVVVASIYDYDSTSAADRKNDQTRKRGALAGCTERTRPVGSTIYFCP
jgi:4-amino-4-deoxy-L-arabinose transferase-like glycosyltransferase